MVRLAPADATDQPRYTVVTEGAKPVTGPRTSGEAGSLGIDVNRNFPEGWWTDDGLPGGTGEYPTSSPEARALVEFAVNHRNILMVQNFHTSGGFTYRVPGTSSDATLAPKDVSVYDYVLGRSIWKSWSAPARSLGQPRKAGRDQGPHARLGPQQVCSGARVRNAPGLDHGLQRRARHALRLRHGHRLVVSAVRGLCHMHRAVESGQDIPDFE